MGILHSYRIKGDTESMENERRGVVTKKEETGRIAEKQNFIPLPQMTGRWGTPATGKIRTFIVLWEFLFSVHWGKQKVGVLHQYEINSSEFLILSLVILNAIWKSHERLDKVVAQTGKKEGKEVLQLHDMRHVTLNYAAMYRRIPDRSLHKPNLKGLLKTSLDKILCFVFVMWQGKRMGNPFCILPWVLWAFFTPINHLQQGKQSCLQVRVITFNL